MNPYLLAIDPGPLMSAYLVFDLTVLHPEEHDIVTNDRLMRHLSAFPHGATVVIEKVESFGMAVGREVFETVWWAGRFYQTALSAGLDPHEVTRREVKLTLCGSSRAKDANIRQVLMDRFGGSGSKGTKKNPGPLYGIHDDIWSALALAVVYASHSTKGTIP